MAADKPCLQLQPSLICIVPYILMVKTTYECSSTKYLLYAFLKNSGLFCSNLDIPSKRQNIFGCHREM